MTRSIHNTAHIVSSHVGDVKVFRNVEIVHSIIQDGCSIGDDTNIERCKFENNVVINRRSYINDSIVGKYTYAGINTTMNYTKIGRFCSLARNVDIGGFDHDYHKVTTMPPFRYAQAKDGGGRLQKDFGGGQTMCEIGNDVWIAAGAQVMHKAKVGDGAVIGGGAVVTKDIPPYAIAVGVPARVIGYRCSEKQIEALEKICWWDWPDDILTRYLDELMRKNIDDATIEWLMAIAKEHSLTHF